MRRLTRNSSGYTFLEMLIAVAMLVIVAFLIVGVAGKPARLIHDYRLRSTSDAEARSAMETILRLLRNGLPGSVVLTNDDPEVGGVTGIPNSHIKFLYHLPSQTVYSIYDIYMTTPPQLQYPIIRMKATSAAGVVVISPQILASYVSFLTFNSDIRDPTLLTVSLHISVPMNGTSQTHDVELLNQLVHVGSAP